MCTFNQIDKRGKTFKAELQIVNMNLNKVHVPSKHNGGCHPATQPP